MSMDLMNKIVERFAQLNPTMVQVGSCNVDLSVYLIPEGTEAEITYWSKPNNSLRVSDHWSWYSNVNKCPYADYIQCELDEIMPYARRGEGLPSPTQYCQAVAYCYMGRYFPLIACGPDGSVMCFADNIALAEKFGWVIPAELTELDAGVHTGPEDLDDIASRYNAYQKGDLKKFSKAVKAAGYDVVYINNYVDDGLWKTELEYISNGEFHDWSYCWG